MSVLVATSPVDDISKTINPTGLSTPPNDSETKKDASESVAQDVADKIGSNCPVNGNPHKHLIGFGYFECKACGVKLDSQSNTEDQDRPDGETSTEDVNGVPKEINGNEPTKHAPITSTIDFRDLRGSRIWSTKWESDIEDYLFNFKSPEASSVSDGKEQRILEEIWHFAGEIEFQPDDSIDGRAVLEDPRYGFRYIGTSIKIHSHAIIDAINAVASFDHQMIGVAPYTLKEPYVELGYHLDLLKDYASTWAPSKQLDNTKVSNGSRMCDEESANHLEVLFRWLDKREYALKLADEKRRNAMGFCTFRMLWSLYKKGTTALMTAEGVLNAYVVDSVEFVRPSPKEYGALSLEDQQGVRYEIQIWNLRYDGKVVRRSFKTVTIPAFEGQKEIDSLKLVPLEFYNENTKESTKKELEDYGRQWFHSLKGWLVEYDGMAMQYQNNAMQYLNKVKQLKGRAYIDPVGDATDGISKNQERFKAEPASERGPGYEEGQCNCSSCMASRAAAKGLSIDTQAPQPESPWKCYDDIDPLKVDSLELPEENIRPRDGILDSQHRYLVCDRLVWALMLSTRSWELLDIKHCTPVSSNPLALKRLVMPDDRKNLIEALVLKFEGTTAAKRGTGWKADYIAGKGEGIIFLLHGSPGVGKTYSIAEFTGRPLLSLACADIGTDEVQVESRLTEWLRIGEKWGAVVLLDEADIFLEQRQVSEIKRNAVVSVFLRCLEYYRGILFLTTNRVKIFDDAFISRIHIAIKYEVLNDKDRKKIWKQFLDKLEEERPNIVIHKRAKEYVLGSNPDDEDDEHDENDDKNAAYKQKWNGREIRNAFQTAVALADYRYIQELKTEDPNAKSKKKQVLGKEDLVQVCNLTKQFKRYLNEEVHLGREEEDREAIRNG